MQGSWLGVRPRPPRTGIPYVAVRVVVYLVALAAIVLIYGTKQRALYIAPPIGLLTGLGTWYLLGDTTADPLRRLYLAGGVGLLLAELTWVLGYWKVPVFVGSAALWFALYVLSGIIEHGAGRSLERRIVVEYSVVASVGVVVILLSMWLWGS